MSGQTRKRFAIVALCAVATLAVGWQVVRTLPKARHGQIHSATITALDSATGNAEIEFVHARSGRVMRLSGSLADAATIRINGTPASLKDLRIGDRVSVRGMLHADRTVVAQEVDVVRTTETPAAAAEN